MRDAFAAEGIKDPLILVARVLLVVLFLIFGWQKLTAYDATVAYFVQGGIPLPAVAALVAVIMELGVGAAIAIGLFTRPLAGLLALYTLATALLGHPFWTLAGAAQTEAEINFFKNVSIIGGLLLLCLTGAGRWSLDRMFRLD